MDRDGLSFQDPLPVTPPLWTLTRRESDIGVHQAFLWSTLADKPSPTRATLATYDVIWLIDQAWPGRKAVLGMILRISPGA